MLTLKSCDSYDYRKETENFDPLSETWEQICEAHWDRMSKPLGGLGALEKTIARIGGIQKKEEVSLGKRALVILCADNGIIEEGVSQSSNDITTSVAKRMGAGLSNVNLMAKSTRVDIYPIDIGIKDEFVHDTVQDLCVVHGTKDFLKEPAMSEEEAGKAVSRGIGIAYQLADNGYEAILLGEMGIGNTTTSSALTAAYLDVPVKIVTGAGAGLPLAKVFHKIEVIEKGIEKHLGFLPGASLRDTEGDVAELLKKTSEEKAGSGCPEPDPFRVLCAVGGLDIAALSGVILGAAVKGIPVILDGFISFAAALTAMKLVPGSEKVLIGSHMSSEPASRMLVEALGIDPVIHAGMHLGEGTGAVAVLPLLDMALNVYNSGETFASAGIEAYTKYT